MSYPSCEIKPFCQSLAAGAGPAYVLLRPTRHLARSTTVSARDRAFEIVERRAWTVNQLSLPIFQTAIWVI